MDFSGVCVMMQKHVAILEATQYIDPQIKTFYNTANLTNMSGDVSPNPGPVKHPCAMCDKPVASSHQAIQCDSCRKWCHIMPKCGKVKVKDDVMSKMMFASK